MSSEGMFVMQTSFAFLLSIFLTLRRMNTEIYGGYVCKNQSSRTRYQWKYI